MHERRVDIGERDEKIRRPNRSQNERSQTGWRDSRRGKIPGGARSIRRRVPSLYRTRPPDSASADVHKGGIADPAIPRATGLLL